MKDLTWLQTDFLMSRQNQHPTTQATKVRIWGNHIGPHLMHLVIEVAGKAWKYMGGDVAKNDSFSYETPLFNSIKKFLITLYRQRFQIYYTLFLFNSKPFFF